MSYFPAELEADKIGFCGRASLVRNQTFLHRAMNCGTLITCQLWQTITFRHTWLITGDIKMSLCLFQISQPQAYPWLIKLCIFSLNFKKRSKPMIEYRRKYNSTWNFNRFSMLYISQIIFVRTGSNLCRKEVTVNSLTSLISRLIQTQYWGVKVKLWLPLSDYTRQWKPNEWMIFSPDLLITLQGHVFILFEQRIWNMEWATFISDLQA